MTIQKMKRPMILKIDDNDSEDDISDDSGSDANKARDDIGYLSNDSENDEATKDDSAKEVE
jgi:hypothetical protein